MSDQKTADQMLDPFRCRVCGVKVDLAPAEGQGICEKHCEDHKYERIADLPWPACVHCGQWAPHDWYDNDYELDY